MKTAALIFGLLAGLIGMGVAALGRLDSGLVAAVDMGDHAAIIARFTLAIIPGISLLGAGLALARPKFAAVVLLLGALAWVALALLVGHGALLFAAAPFTFATAAAWVAFFARNDVELAETPAPSFGLTRTGVPPDERWPEQVAADPRDGRVRGRREEPGFGDDGRSDQRPEYEDEGYRAGPYDNERNDDRPRFAPAYEDEPDADEPAGENHVPIRHAYAAAPREYVRSSPEYALPSQRDPYQEFESYAQPQRPASRVRQVIGVVNVALVVAILTGVSLFLYFEYQKGSLSAILGPHDTTAAVAAPTGARPAVAAAVAPATPANTVPQAPAIAPQAAPVAPAVPAPTVAAAAPNTFDDPLSYCAAVRIVDAPDQRYVGPQLPPVVAAALQVPLSTPPNQVRWRCLSRTPLACSTNNTHRCDVTPSVQEMVSYCAANPDAKDLPAPNGTWLCTGTTPVIPKDQKWPVDQRGFYPAAWVLVPPNAGAPPAG